jgi:uncharacterized membrane protein
MPTVDVTSETVIDRPVSEVAAFAAEPENAPRWYRNIKSVEALTPAPLRVRSRMAFVAEFLGRRLSYTYEVVELDPLRKLVMRTAEGPFPMETTYEWYPEGPARTRMRLRNRGSPSGFMGIVSPFLAMAVGRAGRKDLEQLKRLLETGSRVHPARP